MKRHLALAITTVLASLAAAEATADSWIFGQSTYSHEPLYAQRVHQYAPKQPAMPRYDPTYRESGYRHRRFALHGPGGSADRLHVVQAWGAGEAIRPYGEWQFPFRAGATPFGPWGNPSGPWTLPYDSWQNPYGLGRLPHPPWPHWPNYPPHAVPYGQSGPYPPGYGQGLPGPGFGASGPGYGASGPGYGSPGPGHSPPPPSAPPGPNPPPSSPGPHPQPTP